MLTEISDFARSYATKYAHITNYENTENTEFTTGTPMEIPAIEKLAIKINLDEQDGKFNTQITHTWLQYNKQYNGSSSILQQPDNKNLHLNISKRGQNLKIDSDAVYNFPFEFFQANPEYASQDSSNDEDNKSQNSEVSEASDLELDMDSELMSSCLKSKKSTKSSSSNKSKNRSSPKIFKKFNQLFTQNLNNCPKFTYFLIQVNHEYKVTISFEYLDNSSSSELDTKFFIEKVKNFENLELNLVMEQGKSLMKLLIDGYAFDIDLKDNWFYGLEEMSKEEISGASHSKNRKDSSKNNKQNKKFLTLSDEDSDEVQIIENDTFEVKPPGDRKSSLSESPSKRSKKSSSKQNQKSNLR